MVDKKLRELAEGLKRFGSEEKNDQEKNAGGPKEELKQ
jgi:hypothetical protein